MELMGACGVFVVSMLAGTGIGAAHHYGLTERLWRTWTSRRTLRRVLRWDADRP